MSTARKLPPGPRSWIPGKLFVDLRKDPLAYLTRLTETYGDICTFSAFGQRYIILNHPDLAREVLLTQADAFWKGPALQNSKGILGEGLLTAEGDTHKSQRRMMTPAFHAKHVENYAGDVLDCTRLICDHWQKRNAAIPVDVRHTMMRLTLLIAGRTLFGTLLDEETDLVRRAMEALMNNYVRTVVPGGNLLNYIPLPSTLRLRDAQKAFQSLVERMIADRRKRPQHSGFSTQNASHDLLSTLIAATDPEVGGGCPYGRAVTLTDTQLRDQCITILTAGHETTANAMSFTLYLLAAHPQEQQALINEIDLVLKGRAPTVADIERLPRTRYVLSESMRLLPPAWTLGRQNQREVTIGGYTIPPKCTVLIPQWTLHRDKRFWPDPLTFNPDRWKEPTHPRFAYLPFSTGPRNCIGESFAWLEMSLALPLLLQQFTFQLPPNAPPLRLMPAITLRPRDPVMLTVRPR